MTPDGREWPRITVVTPSYQQGRFLEETIRSVLLQGYPDLEYIVLDGGSSDESVEILRRYEQWLAYSTSERDGGQVQAINAGLTRASGHWRSWLNSDDVYLPGALIRVGSASGASWIVGNTVYINEDSRRIGRFPLSYRSASVVGADGPAWIDALCARASVTALPQQSTFWTEAAQAEVGMLDESLEYAFEHDYWVRLLYLGFSPTVVSDELTLYRVHKDQKTQARTRAASYREEARITETWLSRCPPEHLTAVTAYRRATIRLARKADAHYLAGLIARPLRRLRRPRR